MFNFLQWYFRKSFCPWKFFLSGNGPLPPTGTIDKMDWDNFQTNPSTLAVLCDQTWVIGAIPEAPFARLWLDQVELQSL
jgi:hypothetical protein